MREVDQGVDAFFTRPLEGDWPYMWIDDKGSDYIPREVDDQAMPVLIRFFH